MISEFMILETMGAVKCLVAIWGLMMLYRLVRVADKILKIITEG